MPDPMSFAELAEQHVELLPARTVLSLWRAGAGPPGEPGTPGADGQGMPGSFWRFFFDYDRSGPSQGAASSKNS